MAFISGTQQITRAEDAFLLEILGEEAPHSDRAQDKPSALTIDDLAGAADSEIDAALLAAGLSPLTGTADICDALERIAGGGAPARGDGADGLAEASAPAARFGVRTDLALVAEGFAERLLLDMGDHPRLVVFGPAGCGKSHFIRQVFARAERVNTALGHSAVIDGRVLGMRDVNHFVRELIWSQFGLDEPAFRAFYEGLGEPGTSAAGSGRIDAGDAVRAFFEYRFPERRGIVVIDHFDHLSQRGEIRQFLSKSVFPAAEAHGLRVLLAQRSALPLPDLKLFAVGRNISFPAFTPDDVRAWLDRVFEARPEIAAEADDLILRLGARPFLLDVYRRFAANAKKPGQASIDSFVRHLSRFGHIADCDLFLRAARTSPAFLSAFLSHGGELNSAVAKAIDPACFERLVASGAAVPSVDGEGLAYTSKVHADRLRTLVSPGVFAAVAFRGTDSVLTDKAAWAWFRNYRELAADSVAKAVASEAEPASGLHRLIDILGGWKIGCEVYLRDPANPRLWAPFRKMEALAPFRAVQQPEFAHAIQTGESVHCEDGRWFVPTRGNSGFVSIVWRVSFERSSGMWSEMLQLRALEHLMDGLKVTLSQVIERLAFQFERQLSARIAISSRDERSGHAGLLQSLGCEGWAMLGRDGANESWRALRIETTNRRPGASRLPVIFATCDAAFISRYARHWSGRGVVLRGSQLAAVFPQLCNMSDAVYLQPLTQHGDVQRIVVFVFDLRRQGPISGMVQQKLGRLASDLVLA
jgi:hypothetical protein